jgi:hypothetical protein
MILDIDTKIKKKQILCFVKLRNRYLHHRHHGHPLGEVSITDRADPRDPGVLHLFDSTCASTELTFFFCEI